MSTPVPTAERPPATSGVSPARGRAVDELERDAMVTLIGHRLWHESRAGATARPLLRWETHGLAESVVDLIEQCAPGASLSPMEILDELRGPLPG